MESSLPGLSVTTVTGIVLFGATVLTTVPGFGGWDRHLDIKPSKAAGIGLFVATFSLTLASIRHAGRLPISNMA